LSPLKNRYFWGGNPNFTTTVEKPEGAMLKKVVILAGGLGIEGWPDYVSILPWNIKDEVMQQLTFIREWREQFVIPIPSLEVVR
jgi:hypothetical protein